MDFKPANLGEDHTAAHSGETDSRVFQLQAAADGSVYRLNTRTDEISIIEKESIRPLKETNITALNIGELYRDEKGTVVKYLGELKFESKDYSYLWRK